MTELHIQIKCPHCKKVFTRYLQNDLVAENGSIFVSRNLCPFCGKRVFVKTTVNISTSEEVE